MAEDADYIVVLERANKHLCELYSESKSFVDSDPYVLATEFEPDTGYSMVRLESHRLPPNRIAACVRAAVIDAHSALDFVICANIAARGGDVGRAGFPIVESSDKMKAALKREVQGAGPDVLALVKGLKPYKGGNDYLWALNELRNMNTHRVLASLHGCVEGVQFVASRPPATRTYPSSVSPVPPRSGTPIIQRNIFLLEDGTEVVRVRCSASQPQVNVTAKGAARIAFSEPECVYGEFVYPTTRQIVEYAERVVFALAKLIP